MPPQGAVVLAKVYLFNSWCCTQELTQKIEPPGERNLGVEAQSTGQACQRTIPCRRDSGNGRLGRTRERWRNLSRFSVEAGHLKVGRPEGNGQ